MGLFKEFVRKNKYLISTDSDFEEFKEILFISEIHEFYQKLKFFNSFELIC